MPTKKYAVIFADIVGSTRLYETAGDELAKDLITALETDICEVVSRMGGFVQEIVGDEVMFRFEDVNMGVACACKIQEAVQHFSAARRVQMSVRMGLHFGAAILEQGRIFGDTVNIAARMVGIAQGGQIITTEQVVSNLKGKRRAMARRFDEVRIKGKQQRFVVYDLLCRITNATAISPASMPAAERLSTLTLRYRQESYCLRSRQEAFTIGRSSTNDLVVMSGSVSRRHASVEFGRDRFVLTDTSTNGTYVDTQEGEPIYLRREALPLWGRGRIALGAPLFVGTDHVISFHCE